jgi:hypothetical protein
VEAQVNLPSTFSAHSSHYHQLVGFPDNRRECVCGGDTPGVYSAVNWNQVGKMTIDMGPGSTGAPIHYTRHIIFTFWGSDMSRYST